MSRPKRTKQHKRSHPQAQARQTSNEASGASNHGPRRPKQIRTIGLLLAGAILGVLVTELAHHRPSEVRASRTEPASSKISERQPDRAADQRPAVQASEDGDAVFRYSGAVYQRLERVRREKKAAILSLLGDVERNARKILSDETMLDCFDQMKSLHGKPTEARKQLSDKLRQAVEEYHRAVLEHYALNYNCFHDVLFVSPECYVFHTIRKEADYHKQIDETSVLGRTLHKCLEDGPHEAVVDYHYYAPSDRPSAFFIMPVMKGAAHEGWFILQYPVKMLDSLMVDHDELGSSGEVFLVNRDRLMLTDSKLSGERTHLRFPVKTLDSVAPHDGAWGQGLVVGYRGRRVFRSYERLSALGQSWIIVAQIDEAEVISEYFRANRDACRDRMLRSLTERPIRPRPRRESQAPCRLVGMDEFMKAKADGALRTRGVSTCTAVAVVYPGRFSYLAHISPYDKIYGSYQLTNLLKQAVNTIKYYDICQNELQRLRFVVMATHLNSIDIVLDKLLRYGITLEQIRFAYNPQAWYANILVTSQSGEVTIEWTYQENDAERVLQWASDLPDLADIVRELSRLPNDQSVGALSSDPSESLCSEVSHAPCGAALAPSKPCRRAGCAIR